jgi:protein-tyrosine phosphatase
MTQAQLQKMLSRTGDLSTEQKQKRFAQTMGSQIEEGIWVSDLETVKSVRGRIDHKMDAVVSVCQDACEFNGAEGFHIPIAESSSQEESIGGEMSFAQFAEAADTIGQLLDEDKDILVHCHAGVNRSVGTLAAALAVRRDLTVVEAISLIKSQRRIANPLQKTRAWMQAYIAGMHATKEQRETVDQIIHQATAPRRKKSGGYSGSPNGSYAGRDGTYSVNSTDQSSTRPDPDLTEIEGWNDLDELEADDEQSNNSGDGSSLRWNDSPNGEDESTGSSIREKVSDHFPF